MMVMIGSNINDKVGQDERHPPPPPAPTSALNHDQGRMLLSSLLGCRRLLSGQIGEGGGESEIGEDILFEFSELKWNPNSKQNLKILIRTTRKKRWISEVERKEKPPLCKNKT